MRLDGFCKIRIFLTSTHVVKTILGRWHRWSDFAYWYQSYCSVVCQSITFVHCAQAAEDTDTISFEYDDPVSLPDRVEIWLTLADPFFRKVIHPCWFACWRYLMANCSRMFRNSSVVTVESLQENTVALLNGAIATLVWPPLPPKWGPKCNPGTNFAMCDTPWWICIWQPHCAISPFAKLLLSLLILPIYDIITAPWTCVVMDHECQHAKCL